MDEAMKKGDLIKGRQIVTLLLLNFKTFDSSEIVYGIDHLCALSCGPNLHAFLSQWNNILDNMSGELPDVWLRDVFYRRVKDNKDMLEDIKEYNRFREGNPDKTYQWLMEQIQTHIRLKRQNRNMADREAALTIATNRKSGGRAAPAEAPEGDGTVNPKAK